MKNRRPRLCQEAYNQRKLHRHFGGSLVFMFGFLLDSLKETSLHWLKGGYLKIFFFFWNSLIYNKFYAHLYAPQTLTSK